MTQIYTPHPYQRYAENFLITHPNAGLFLDMGLGKTSIVLSAIEDLKYNRFQVNRTLVIAPKKVAEGTWQAEARKWAHTNRLRISTVLGTTAKRIQALSTPADLYIINRENTQWLVDYYKNDWPFDTVVLDESSSFKNHKAKRFKALTWVRGHIRRIYELTGTPSPNGLLDLWSQVFLLDGGARLGRSFGGFRARYFDADQRSQNQVFSYKPKKGAEEAIYHQISDICISMKASDYLSLPECTTVVVPVKLSPAAQRAYNKLEKSMLLQVDDSQITAQSAAVLGNKLLQLCNGAVYDENREPVEIHHDKIEAFMELVEALQGKSALVFYNFKHDVPRLEAALAPTGLRVRELHGQKDVDDWNAHKIDILLAHPASCAYGLNLQDGGSHIIWFGLNWGLELFQQANKRLHRQGQKNPVFIHILSVVGGIDEDVMNALTKKGEMQRSLLTALTARIKKVKGEI